MDELISRTEFLKGFSYHAPEERFTPDEVIYLINKAPSVPADVVPITGDTSDGYHTFNELYHHRAVLFSVICNDRPEVAWKSKRHHDGTMYDGMFIVGIQTPEGQATYHYDVNPYWDMFRVRELPQAPEWDGHTPSEAIMRIGKLPEPVRHARWEYREELQYFTIIEMMDCSVCGEHQNPEQVEAWAYCPNCGARMDLPDPARAEKEDSR